MNDIFTSNEYELEYELFQIYPRFKVYNVYKKYKKTGEKKFLYRITKERTDFGRCLADRKELLEDLNKKIGYHNGIR